MSSINVLHNWCYGRMLMSNEKLAKVEVSKPVRRSQEILNIMGKPRLKIEVRLSCA
jgi:hypothetical protein